MLAAEVTADTDLTQTAEALMTAVDVLTVAAKKLKSMTLGRGWSGKPKPKPTAKPMVKPGPPKPAGSN